MTNNPARPMKGWGDLNAALNALVHEGVITGFRTNRSDKNSDPEIVISIRPDAKEVFAMRLVREALTGVFEDAELSVEVAE